MLSQETNWGKVAYDDIVIKMSQLLEGDKALPADVSLKILHFKAAVIMLDKKHSAVATSFDPFKLSVECEIPTSFSFKRARTRGEKKLIAFINGKS